MQLASAFYILFLLAAVLAWLSVPLRLRPALLLLASLAFYAPAGPLYLLLLVLVAAADHLILRHLTGSPDGPLRRTLFTFAVLLNIGLLVFFKWAAGRPLPGPMLTAGFARLLAPAGTGVLPFPLGLSFFTFQMLGTITDVYRREFQWTGRAGSFLLYGLFFPQVSSGPIPRAASLLPQLLKPKPAAYGDIASGVFLIAQGLLKTFVVANRLHPYVEEVFATAAPAGAVTLLLAFVLNAVELYADFSGYTDIARGSARLFGIQLADNFDRPFLATSVTDFWRRWHITLSTWLRDYLYMPLLVRLRAFGTGAAVGSFLLTFAVCGIWHKVTWNLFLFGILHGLALSGEFLTRKPRRRLARNLPAIVVTIASRFYAVGFFVLSLILFRTGTLRQAWTLLKSACHPAAPALAGLFGREGPVMFALMLGALLSWRVMARLEEDRAERFAPVFVLACALLVLFLGKLREGNFIYVQF